MILTLEGVHTYIGQHHILQGVSLAVPEGGCTALIGRNGAGKTTTLRTIMGLLQPRQGEIRLAGRRIDGLPPYAVARLGVAYVPEDRGVFADLTVEENLRLALPPGVRLAARKERVLALFPDLAGLWHRRGGQLSGGQQQMVAIARALMTDARLILLDEPSKGLAPLVVRQVAEALALLKREVTLLLVEQNLALAGAVADRYVALDSGRTVGAGSMADLLANPDLQARYLGVRGVA